MAKFSFLTVFELTSEAAVAFERYQWFISTTLDQAVLSLLPTSLGSGLRSDYSSMLVLCEFLARFAAQVDVGAAVLQSIIVSFAQHFCRVRRFTVLRWRVVYNELCAPTRHRFSTVGC